MEKQKSKPAPLETRPGHQMDDNVDDLGHKGEKEKLEQPVGPTKKPADDKGH